MTKILITGAAGFCGQAICQALSERGDTVIAMVMAGDPDINMLSLKVPDTIIEQADMVSSVSVEKVFSKHCPDVVIHCAAVVGVMVSLEDPASVFNVNVNGSINIMQAMVRHGVKRMLHISSEEIYGHFQADMVSEEHPQYPIFAYGIAKSAVEHIGRTFAVTDGLEVINLRTSWVYGPGFPRSRVPVNMIRAAAAGTELHIPVGAATRIDHTYIDDLVNGVLAALDHPIHHYDAYHIASGTAPSLSEIADILNVACPEAKITVGKGPYQHAVNVIVPRKGALNCQRAQTAFGFESKFDIASGISAYLEALKQSEKTELEGC